jgi:hypothetical protein
MVLILQATPTFAQTGVDGLGNVAADFFADLQGILQGIALAAAAVSFLTLGMIYVLSTWPPAAPECTSADTRAALADLLSAMDATILALENWSNGTTDSTQTSIDLQNAETALRDARVNIRQ